MPTLRSIAFSLITISSAAAQGSEVVIPAIAAKSEKGKFLAPYLFYGSTAPNSTQNSHTQILYDTRDISVEDGILVGLAWRLHNYARYTQQGTVVQVSLQLSLSAHDHTSLSPVFADNYTQPPVYVFSGLVSLPVRTSGISWPNPWEPQLPFNSPVVYSRHRGRSLLIDVLSRNNVARLSWDADAYMFDYGKFTGRLLAQPDCVHSGGRGTGGFNRLQFQPHAGGSFFLEYGSLPSEKPSFAMSRLVFGFQGDGGTAFGRRLPLLLRSLAIPSYAGCLWNISWDLDDAIEYIPAPGTQNQGRLRYSQRFPADPSLGGSIFYTQAVGLDTDAQTGMLQVFPTYGLEWLMGSGVPVPASTVYVVNDTQLPQPSGTILSGEAPVFRLFFRP